MSLLGRDGPRNAAGAVVRVKVGDRVMLYPSGEISKVRGLQVHNQSLEQSEAVAEPAVDLVEFLALAGVALGVGFSVGMAALMTGLAGIGSVFLQLAAPGEYPCAGLLNLAPLPGRLKSL